MPAETGLHDVGGEFTGFEILKAVGKGLFKHVGGRPFDQSALAAVLLGVNRIGFREFGEIRAALHLTEQAFRGHLVFDENVAHLHFGVAPLGFVFVKDLAGVCVGYGVFLRVVGDEGVHIDAVGRGFHGLLHVGAAINLGFFGFLQQHRLANQLILHRSFEFRRLLLASGDEHIDDLILFGLGDGLAVHLKSGSGGKGALSAESCGNGGESECFEIHDAVLKKIS